MLYQVCPRYGGSHKTIVLTNIVRLRIFLSSPLHRGWFFLGHRERVFGITSFTLGGRVLSLSGSLPSAGCPLLGAGSLGLTGTLSVLWEGRAESAVMCIVCSFAHSLTHSLTHSISYKRVEGEKGKAVCKHVPSCWLLWLLDLLFSFSVSSTSASSPAAEREHSPSS